MRLPRMTTRRWMIVVAVAAITLAAGMLIRDWWANVVRWWLYWQSIRTLEG
jgi:hypothetical protein